MVKQAMSMAAWQSISGSTWTHYASKLLELAPYAAMYLSNWSARFRAAGCDRVLLCEWSALLLLASCADAGSVRAKAWFHAKRRSERAWHTWPCTGTLTENTVSAPQPASTHVSNGGSGYPEGPPPSQLKFAYNTADARATIAASWATVKSTSSAG